MQIRPSHDDIYQWIGNWWNLNICFHVWGIPPWFCATDAQTSMWLFWTRILAWKRTSAIFLHGGSTFSWNWISNFFCRSLCCISLNHNSVLLSKQNSVHDPKRRKIHLFFYRNYNYYTICVVIWCSAPVSDVKTAMQNRRVWRAMIVDRRQHSISVAAYEFMIMTIRIQV